jgi:hypothetical protein
MVGSGFPFRNIEKNPGSLLSGLANKDVRPKVAQENAILPVSEPKHE